MKTAISLPDSLFHSADELAKRLGISRSELYQRAVARFLDDHQEELVTKKLNEVYEEDPTASRLDPAWERAQSQPLEDEDW